MDIIEEQLNQIDNINNQIKKYNNSKRIKKLLLKKYKCELTLKKTIPYVVTTGIIAGTFSIMGYAPFIFDRKKEYLNSKKMIDSENNIKIEEFYDSKEDKLFNTISIVSNWSKKGDMYERTITTYDAHLYNEEELIRLISEEDNVSLDKLFNKYISRTKEQSNSISEEELNKDCYLIITVYDYDSGKFRYIKETASTNFVTTFITLLIILGANFVVNTVSSGNGLGEARYQEQIEKLNEKYPNIDIDELKRKLEIRKENYQRLTR